MYTAAAVVLAEDEPLLVQAVPADAVGHIVLGNEQAVGIVVAVESAFLRFGGGQVGGVAFPAGCAVEHIGLRGARVGKRHIVHRGVRQAQGGAARLGGICVHRPRYAHGRQVKPVGLARLEGELLLHRPACPQGHVFPDRVPAEIPWLVPVIPSVQGVAASGGLGFLGLLPPEDALAVCGRAPGGVEAHCYLGAVVYSAVAGDAAQIGAAVYDGLGRPTPGVHVHIPVEDAVMDGDHSGGTGGNVYLRFSQEGAAGDAARLHFYRSVKVAVFQHRAGGGYLDAALRTAALDRAAVYVQAAAFCEVGAVAVVFADGTGDGAAGAVGLPAVDLSGEFAAGDGAAAADHLAVEDAAGDAGQGAVHLGIEYTAADGAGAVYRLGEGRAESRGGAAANGALV